MKNRLHTARVVSESSAAVSIEWDTKVQPQISYLMELPAELIILILSSCSIGDIKNVSRTCRPLYEISVSVE
jgi:hypothetical protein